MFLPPQPAPSPATPPEPGAGTGLHPLEAVLAQWPTAVALVLGIPAELEAAALGEVEIVLSAGAQALAAGLLDGEQVLVERAARVALDAGGEGVEPHVTADGEPLHLRAELRPVEGGVLVEFVDVSDLAARRDTLEAEERLLERLLEAFPLAVVLTDPSDGYRVVGANRRFEELFGRYRDDVIGTFPEEHLDLEAARAGREFVEGVFAGGQVVAHEETRETPLGPRRLRVVRVPIFDASGRPEHLATVFEDVTEAREARQRLESASTLRQRVVEGFGGGVRSDLTRLLEELGASAGTLGPLDHPSAAPLAEARGIAERILARVEDVLAATVAATSPQKADDARFDPIELVDTLLGSFAARAEERGVELAVCDVRPKDQRVPASGDARRLRLALGHLVSNALQHSSRGDRVVVEVDRPARAAKLVFSVRDDGIGMPDDLLASLNGSERASGAPCSAESSGLGLTLAFQLVDFMRGRLRFESTLGEGSTVRLEVPQAGAEAEPEVRPVPATTGVRALVIDDDLAAQRVLRRRLQAAGHSADIAANGVEALKLLRTSTSRYDHVFVDLRMPGLDGPELIERIRDEERESRGPSHTIVALSSAPSGSVEADEDCRRSLAAGADVCLRKPIRRTDLDAVLG